MLSRQPPHVHPSSPFTGEEGGQGESEGRQLSIPFPVPCWRCYGRALVTAQVFDEALRCSPLQPTPLLSA